MNLPFFRKVKSSNATDGNLSKTYDIESEQSKNGRVLRQFIKLNHAKNSVLPYNDQWGNSLPYVLCSAFVLGADGTRLEHIYDKYSGQLGAWDASPGEVSLHDWQEYLGDGRFQRAYLDFFEDELVTSGFGHRRVLDEFLFGPESPLINRVMSGTAQPLIYLGYAYEFSSRDMAMEALALISTSPSYLHRYFEEPFYSRPNTFTWGALSLSDLLAKVAVDKRLPLAEESLPDDLGVTFKNYEALLLEYWKSWEFSDPTVQLSKIQHLATCLLLGRRTKCELRFDLLFVNLLTSCHAIRVLLPLTPEDRRTPLIRQWWLWALGVYVMRGRPPIEIGLIEATLLEGRNWNLVTSKALEGKWVSDVAIVTVVRALREAAQAHQEDAKFYLKAAIRVIEEVDCSMRMIQD